MKRNTPSVLTADRIRYLFDFLPERGVLVRRVGRFKGAICGEGAPGGYTRFRIDKEFFALHRAIWLHQYGTWPVGFIDHINGDTTDNRLCNLRDVDHVTNMQNQRKALKNSKTGLLGAHPIRGGKFAAQITVGGRLRHLGVFATAQVAHEAYLAAKRELHVGCTI